MKTVRRFIAVLAGVFVLATLMGALFTVREDQYAAVLQFGRIVRVESTSGLKFKLPVVQTVTYIPKAVQLYDTSASDVITEDKKSMIADNYILWRVTEPVKYVQTLSASSAMAEDRAAVAAYNATKNIISSMTQDEIIASRGERLTTLITTDANNNVGNYGIEIVKVEIKALDLPEDNKEAVYERMISERNNIAASYKAAGDAEAQKIRNETDRQVTILTAEAKKKAAILEAEGEAMYMQTLSEAYNDPDKADFYNYVRGLDALKLSMSGKDKTLILDSSSELARILYGADLQ